MNIKANYHTHTTRCGHAEGTDEQYVQAALAQGFHELGFSDHMPWPYKSSFSNPRVRMSVERMDDYLASVRQLQKKYAGQISVLAGFEAEYFPEYMGWLADVKAERQLDYLILGNHYDLTDETGMYFGLCRRADQLRRYVDNTIKGMETGLFAYLAHPDLFMRGYKAFDDDCRAAAKDLAQACRAINLPMEYNVHERFIFPITNRISYPAPEFFEIAAGEGVRFVLGLDAHEPEELSNPTEWVRGEKELEPYESLRIRQLDLRK